MLAQVKWYDFYRVQSFLTAQLHVADENAAGLDHRAYLARFHCARKHRRRFLA